MLFFTLLTFFATAAMRGSAAPHIGIFPTLTSNNYTGAYQDWVAEFGATSTVLPSRFDEPDQLEKART